MQQEWDGTSAKDVRKRGQGQVSVPNHQAAEKQWLVVREFVSEREDWSSYIEQLESYFVVNYVVTSDKKHAILLSVCGPRTCQLIRNLTTPVTQSLK